MRILVAVLIAACGCSAPPKRVDLRADVSALVPTPVSVTVCCSVQR